MASSQNPHGAEGRSALSTEEAEEGPMVPVDEYDTRNNNPVFRVVATAKRAARVRASSENADARTRVRSGDGEPLQFVRQ